MAMASAPASAVCELVAKGRESAISLRAMLGQQPGVGCSSEGASATTPHGLEDLAEQILRCFDRALAAMDSAATSRKRKPEDGLPTPPPPATSSKRMRLSMSGGERATARVAKKWTMEDGFLWRKYGQKDIHGSKYPRLYFRCTYKEDHGCMARRQVQQSEDDPSVYLINYFGEHTCCRDDDGVPESPEPFVINFGASTMDGKPSSSPAWPSSDGDSPVVSETSDNLCHSPADEKELGAGMGYAAELIEQSTPVPELTSMSSPEWDPLDGSLVWDMGSGDSLFDDIGEFTHLDYYIRLFQ